MEFLYQFQPKNLKCQLVFGSQEPKLEPLDLTLQIGSNCNINYNHCCFTFDTKFSFVRLFELWVCMHFFIFLNLIILVLTFFSNSRTFRIDLKTQLVDKALQWGHSQNKGLKMRQWSSQAWYFRTIPHLKLYSIQNISEPHHDA